jgi:hypothetical protein
MAVGMGGWVVVVVVVVEKEREEQEERMGERSMVRTVRFPILEVRSATCRYRQWPHLQLCLGGISCGDRVHGCS